MHKKLTSLLALGMAFGFVFSGCNSEPPPASPPVFNPADFASAETDGEIYQSLQYGLNALLGYNGDLTAEREYVYKQEDGSGMYIKDESYTKKSVDFSEKIFYNTENFAREEAYDGITSGSFTSDRIEKYYAEEGGFYKYDSIQANEGTPDESYFSTEQKQVDYHLATLFSNGAGMVTQTVRTILSAQDFSALKNAYETIYSQQLSARKTEDENAKAEVNFTLDNVDGVLDMVVTKATETVKTIGGEAERWIKNEIVSITGENGKITGIHELLSMRKISEAEENSKEEEWSLSMEATVSFDYVFDKDGFDAIFVQTPQTVQSENVSDSIGIVFDFNGVTYFGFTYTNPTTALDALNEMQSNFLSGTGHTVTYYTDEERTSAFNVADSSIADLRNVQKLYATITVNDGYALVLTEREVKDARSDAYKTVFGVNDDLVRGLRIASTSIEQDNEQLVNTDGVEEVYVNGEKLVGNTFTAENKGVYKITFVSRILQDSDYDIFDI